jgi:excisionase family DNA binding protein
MMTEKRIGVRGASEALGIRLRRVQQLIESGTLPAERISGRWIINTADVRRLVRQRGGKGPLRGRMNR